MTIDPERARALAEAYTAAWNSGSPDAVASIFSPNGQIVINRGKPWIGREGVAAMAAGFFGDVPDLALSLRVVGWEEWDLDPDLQVVASRGWFDAADCERQTTAR